MQIHIEKEELRYDGSQLSSHFALKRFKVRGDSLVAFKGPMEIEKRHMADLEDLLEDAAIRSPYMLHFIAEFFGAPLENTVLKQRLLVRLAADILKEECGADLCVKGDDIFMKDRKLSVSIAAPSPVSCLIHLGINIETEGVPVKAAGLKEMGMDPDRMADLLIRAFSDEMDSLAWAMTKVKGVP
ncbi:MAG: DUF366 family protein [Planctomycetota bacterium]